MKAFKSLPLLLSVSLAIVTTPARSTTSTSGATTTYNSASISTTPVINTSTSPGISTTPVSITSNSPTMSASVTTSANSTDVAHTSNTSAIPVTTNSNSPTASDIIGSPTRGTEDAMTSLVLSTTQGHSWENTSSGLPQVLSSPAAGSTSTVAVGPNTRCQATSCGAGAFCVNLYNNYTCLCTEGNFYSSGTCQRGKSFLGEIKVQVSNTSNLQNESSLAYENLWKNIVTFFQEAFKDTDYRQTVIHTVSISSPQARTVQVFVKVTNIFEENTKETEATVSAKIEAAVKNNTKNILLYAQQNQCDYYGCEDTNQDNCSSSLNCQCKDGLQRPYLQSPFCLALQCSDDCKAENNQQCLKHSTGQSECVCLPGYKMTSTSTICQKCPFGYSGLNCEDQFQLILTIVGTILGVFVLSLVIALVVTMRSTNRKKNTEEQRLIENDFQNLRMQQTGFSNLGAGGSLFPEVKTDASSVYQSSNPYAN